MAEAVDAANAALDGDDSAATMAALSNTALGIKGLDEEHADKYHASLKKKKAAAGGPLGVPELQAGVTDVNEGGISSFSLRWLTRYQGNQLWMVYLQLSRVTTVMPHSNSFEEVQGSLVFKDLTKALPTSTIRPLRVFQLIR